MIDKGPATADEMVLAFLQAEIESPTIRGNLIADAVIRINADRTQLIDRGDLKDRQQNNARRWILSDTRGALFQRFPGGTSWRLVTVTPDEVKGFKYVNHPEGWATVSGSTRLVADGVKNLDQVQNPEYKRNVTGIADRLRQGERFPPLIAVQCTGIADVVLMEGHTRATAHALTGLPDEIEAIIGTSAFMGSWLFY